MRYHKDIGFPSSFTPPKGVLKLNVSPHAAERAAQKGILRLPTSIKMWKYDVIEAFIHNGRAAKIVIRGKYDQERDLCLAISLWYGEPTIKTAWLNSSTDTHSTLDTSLYGRP